MMKLEKTRTRKEMNTPQQQAEQARHHLRLAMRKSREKTLAPDSQNADTEGQFIVNRLINYDRYENTFRSRWEGYGAKDDTWEPPLHLPYNMMCRYLRKFSRIPFAR